MNTHTETKPQKTEEKTLIFYSTFSHAKLSPVTGLISQNTFKHRLLISTVHHISVFSLKIRSFPPSSVSSRGLLVKTKAEPLTPSSGDIRHTSQCWTPSCSLLYSFYQKPSDDVFFFLTACNNSGIISFIKLASRNTQKPQRQKHGPTCKPLHAHLQANGYLCLSYAFLFNWFNLPPHTVRWAINLAEGREGVVHSWWNKVGGKLRYDDCLFL